MILKELLNQGMTVLFEGNTAAINHPSLGEKVLKIPLHYLFTEKGEEVEMMHYYLKTIAGIHKTPEEKSAEEAVRKAEASLKAAKETLSKIKEKK